MAGELSIDRARGAQDYRDLYDMLIAYEAYLPEALRHGVVPQPEELARIFGEPSAALLARVDGVTIGCICIDAENTTSVRMRHLFVDPAQRSHGAGRALVSGLIDFAREHGYKRVVLDTHKGILDAAYGLYRSFGFVEYEPDVITVDYPCPTFMELWLTSSV